MASEKNTQRERFEQAARELGVELDEEKLKDALRRVASKPRTKSKREDNEG